MWALLLFIELAVAQIQVAPHCYSCDNDEHIFPACVNRMITCHLDEVCSITYGDGLPTFRCQKNNTCVRDISHPLGNCTGGGVQVQQNMCELCCHTSECVQGIKDALLLEFPVHLPYHGLFCPGRCIETDLATCVRTGVYCHDGQFCKVGINDNLMVQGHCVDNDNIQECFDDKSEDPCVLPVGQSGQMSQCVWDCCSTTSCLTAHFGGYLDSSVNQTHVGPTLELVAPTCYSCDSEENPFPACVNRQITCHLDEVCSVSYGDGLPTFKCQKANTCVRDISHPLGNCTGGGVQVQQNQCELCCHTSECVQGIKDTLLLEFPLHLPYHGLFCPGRCLETDLATCVQTGTYCHDGQFCQVGINDNLRVQGHCVDNEDIQECFDDKSESPCVLPVGQSGDMSQCVWDCCTTTSCLTAHFGEYLDTTLRPQVTQVTTTATQEPTTKTTTLLTTTTTTQAQTSATTTQAPTSTTTTQAPTTTTTTQAPTTTTQAPTTTTQAPTTTTQAPTTTTTTQAPTTTTQAPTTTTTKGTTQGHLVITMIPPSTVESQVSVNTPLPAATAETVETHNDPPVFCTSCSDDDCSSTADVAYCMQGFCKVTITDDATGKRHLTKSCGNRAECRALWWDQTSHNQQCMTTLTTLGTATHTDLSCTYCCQSTYCSDTLSASNLVTFS